MLKVFFYLIQLSNVCFFLIISRSSSRDIMFGSDWWKFMSINTDVTLLRMRTYGIVGH